ncbi:MAG: FtsQ-type POTRA domain-containing protein [Deltaproteobacteria bacterium]|nr:FtsQ-type POTRA domain-containing protein [Deltaproteobacteria bacterium]
MARERRTRRGSASRSSPVTWVRAPKARAEKSVRSAGDRAWQRSKRGEQRRGERARSHLDRIRSRSGRRSLDHLRFVLGGAFACSLAAGAWLAMPVVAALESGWVSEPFLLDAISVQGNHRLEASSVAVATGVAKGSPFEDVRSEAVEAALLAHPWIRSAEALRLPTGRLLVKIDEHEPRAALRLQNAPRDNARWRLVDASGVPFAPAEPGDVATLPHLRGTSTIAQSGQESPELARGVAVLESLSRLAARAGEDAAGLAGAELALPEANSSRGWVLHMGDPQREVILGESGLDQRLEHLALLLDAEPEALGAAREIDLRFADRAVLRSTSTSR